MSSFRRMLMMARKRQKPEYTELEYIESTGTQYIDTEYMINYLNKIEFKIQDPIFPTTVSESFLGAGDTATNNIIALYLDHNHQCLGYRINSNGYNDTQIGDTDKLSGTPTVTIDNGNIALNNGNNEYSYSYKNIQCYTNRNCYIFSRNQGDRIMPKSKVKLCYFKIWDNNALIRDFIPVLDKNNTPCLYDKVTKQYFYNQGTGEFLYKEKSKLPGEYQEVEYLEATGTQYIDTNEKPNINTKIYSRYYTGNLDGKNHYLFGCYNSKGAARCQFNCSNGGAFVGFGKEKNYKYDAVALEKERLYDIKMDKGDFYLDNNLICSFQNSELDFESPVNIYLFANNSNNTIGALSDKTRVYYLKIFDDDHMVKNFIPCYRKSDGEAGFYDNVEGKFYTNQGTGTFLKGVDV